MGVFIHLPANQFNGAGGRRVYEGKVEVVCATIVAAGSGLVLSF